MRRSLREVRARLGLRKTSKHLARRDIKKTGGDSRTYGWDTYDPWGWKCLGRFEGSLYEEMAGHTGNTPLRGNRSLAMDLSLGFKIYEDWSVLDRAVLSLDASPPRLPPRGAQCSPPPVMRTLKKKPDTEGEYEVVEPMSHTQSISIDHKTPGKATPQNSFSLDRRLRCGGGSCAG